MPMIWVRHPVVSGDDTALLNLGSQDRSIGARARALGAAIPGIHGA